MKIAHLADIHLGYRAFHRVAWTGTNQREIDVAEAVMRVVAEIDDVGPDLVVVAGDVFDTPRPTPHSLACAIACFKRLARRRPVVVVAGNHDTPRRRGDGNPLWVLGRGVPDLHVATNRGAIMTDAGPVLAVPHGCGDPVEVLAWGRDTFARDDTKSEDVVVVIHAAIAESQRSILYGPGTTTIAELDPDAWLYVALGDYHLYTVLAANACYAGPVARIAQGGPWTFAGRPPTSGYLEIPVGPVGWVLYDTDTGAMEHFRNADRAVFDLAPIDAAGLDSAQLTDAIVQQARDEYIAGSIVRQRVTNATRDVVRDVDHAAVRRIKADAFHYQLEFQPPERSRDDATNAVQRAMEKGGGRLVDVVRSYADDVWEPPPGVDRATVRDYAVAKVENASDPAGGDA